MFGGIIIKGEGIGKALGFPTANIDCEKDKVHLGGGVYAAIAMLDSKKYVAALVIVTAPWKVEAHLVGYNGPDVYGEFLSVSPVQKISTLETYASEDELKEKIAADVLLVKEFFQDIL